ncbi:MAG: hypothetical protein J6I58_06485 [Eubacterium sp.]|nr:hypothetical protein [Eubacterium sp.]
MKDTSNKVLSVILIAIIIILLIILIKGIFTPAGESITDFLPFKSKGEEETIYNSINEIAAKINGEIEKGTEGEISLMVSTNVSSEELKDVYYMIDSMVGTIKSITTYENGEENYRKVVFDYEKADSMYVYESIVENKEIPADKSRAKQMESICKSFLNENIKPGMSDYEKELCIHDYIVENTVYGFSLSHDDSEFNAYGALVNGRAVCSGYAAAMNLLLRCAGVESKIVIGDATDIYSKDSKTEKHAWNQVKVDGIWYNMDATWDDPVGAGEDRITHQYFNVKDDILDDTHTWKTENAEKCDSMKANYYLYNNSYISDASSLELYITNAYNINGKGNIECALNNLDINDDNLQFIFQLSGVESVKYSVTGSSEYSILSVYIN